LEGKEKAETVERKARGKGFPPSRGRLRGVSNGREKSCDGRGTGTTGGSLLNAQDHGFKNRGGPDLINLRFLKKKKKK